jgi:hypothetical protein
LFLLDDALRKVGKPVDIKIRGAIQLDGMMALALQKSRWTLFSELNFETGEYRDIFVIKKRIDHVFAYYDSTTRHAHLMIFPRRGDSHHLLLDLNSYDRVKMRSGIDRLIGRCHVRRLNRLYTCYGDVYDLATAEFLKPIALKG